MHSRQWPCCRSPLRRRMLDAAARPRGNGFQLGMQPPRLTAYAPKFFTAHEWRTVRVLADYDHPARRALRAARPTQRFPSSWTGSWPTTRATATAARRCTAGSRGSTPNARTRFGKTFVDATDAQRRAVLDDIAWPKKAKPEISQGVAFFNSLPRPDCASGSSRARWAGKDVRLRRQRVQSELERLPAGSAGQARRFARPDEDARSQSRRDRHDSASASSAAASTRASTCRRSPACATPTCSASGVRTRRTQRSAAHMRAKLDVGDARRVSVHRATWSPIRRSTRSGSAARITRASRTSRRSSTPCDGGAARCEASPARSRSRATSPRRSRCSQTRARASDSCTGYLENQLFAPQIDTRHGADLGARRGDDRPAVSRARGRGAQRAAHAVVLAGDASGRRRAQRHDVPLGRGRRHSAHEAGRAARIVTPVRITAHIASLKWSRPEYAKQLSTTMGKDVDYTQAGRPKTSRA